MNRNSGKLCLKGFGWLIAIILEVANEAEEEVPENVGKEWSLERRRNYLRGFPTVNCNYFKTEKLLIFGPRQ